MLTRAFVSPIRLDQLYILADRSASAVSVVRLIADDYVALVTKAEFSRFVQITASETAEVGLLNFRIATETQFYYFRGSASTSVTEANLLLLAARLHDAV